MSTLRKYSSQWSAWALFEVLTMCLVAKSVIWHMQFFGDKEFELLGTVGFSMLLASGVLLCRRRPWWIFVLLAATNVWLFANFTYERAWGQMLSMDMIRMARNLHGFEDSLLIYFRPDMLYWLALPDIVCLFTLLAWKPVEKRMWRSFAVVILVVLCLIPVQQRKYYNQVYLSRVGYNNHTGFAHWWYIREPLFNPVTWPQDAAFATFTTQEPQTWERPYVYRYGILQYGHALCAYDARYHKWEQTLLHEALELTPEQKQQMARLTGPEPDFHPQRSLILILVESLESWAIDYPTHSGYVMPNLRNFIHSHHVYYSTRLYNQLGYGGSSDGQLMALTGLVPVYQGVSVALYGDQKFPNYCHYFPHSVTLNPSPGIWKQQIVNPNYGIMELEESDSIRDDAGIFHRLNAMDLSEPTFVLAITVSSHVPFAKGDEVELDIDEDMPGNMGKYLKCLHYMDEHLGTFLSRVDSDPMLAQSDIVITGDHIIFYSQDWCQMQDYAQSKGIDCLGNDVNTSPLILYSPTFTQTTVSEDEILQMDIYPTILHMIGCTAPAWKGVGMDLLGDEPRTISREAARDLSDKLIRSRYFESLNK